MIRATLELLVVLLAASNEALLTLNTTKSSEVRTKKWSAGG